MVLVISYCFNSPFLYFRYRCKDSKYWRIVERCVRVIYLFLHDGNGLNTIQAACSSNRQPEKYIALILSWIILRLFLPQVLLRGAR